MMTKTSDDYITNYEWLSDVITGNELILRGVSALEFLELFSGYWQEKRIDVYAKEKGEYENVRYCVLDTFDEIDYIKSENTLCTSVNQTFNDLLNHESNSDELALIEALSNYYFAHNQSFEGLIIDPNNTVYFNYLKPLAIKYYNTGE